MNKIKTFICDPVGFALGLCIVFFMAAVQRMEDKHDKSRPWE